MPKTNIIQVIIKRSKILSWKEQSVPEICALPYKEMLCALPYKDRICDSVVIQKNKGLWKPLYSHIYALIQLGKKYFKCYIGYLNHYCDDIKPLHIKLPKLIVLIIKFGKVNILAFCHLCLKKNMNTHWKSLIKYWIGSRTLLKKIWRWSSSWR